MSLSMANKSAERVPLPAGAHRGEICAQLPQHPSLRAQRSNPESFRGNSLDCFVARAPRNDGCGKSGAKISHCDLGQRQCLPRLQPSSRLAMMHPESFGAHGNDGSNGGLRCGGAIDDGACGVGECARHGDRVVRLPDLRHGRSPRAQQAVLPELRSRSSARWRRSRPMRSASWRGRSAAPSSGITAIGSDARGCWSRP